MQFSVPQFVEIEDKIIGPLTLKQFLILLSGGLIELMIYSLFKNSILFLILFSLPVVAFFGYLAFGKLNGRPVLGSLPSVLKFISTPKVWIFERTGEKAISMSKKSPAVLPNQKRLEPGQVGSQLKRLAYLLDQKTAEEERLIHSGDMERKWLNQIK